MQFLFPGFVTKALTFSYDDGALQDRRLAALLRQYGLTGTFNLNSGNLDVVGIGHHQGFALNMSKIHAYEVRDLYASFEVASHTVSHPRLIELADEEVRRQVAEDKEKLEQLSGRPVTGFAYPFGEYDERIKGILRETGIRYARTVESRHDFSLPEDFLAWHPTCHDHGEALPALADAFLESGGGLRVFYVWGHSFELDKDDCDRWGALETFCAKMARRPDIWYATNGAICGYVTAARQAVVRDGRLVNPSGEALYIRLDGEDCRLAPGGELPLPPGESWTAV